MLLKMLLETRVDFQKKKKKKCMKRDNKEVVTATPCCHFTNRGQKGHRVGLAEEEGKERCFMALSCRQTEP